MLFNSFIVSSVILAASTQVYGHAIISPALGVTGTPARSDVTRPNIFKPCGVQSGNVASLMAQSTSLAATGNSFTTNITNFNGGIDGSRQVTAQVDPTGVGKTFTAATVTTNGDLNPQGVGSQTLTVEMPAGMACTGGANKDTCLVSMKTAGGFGNCIAVTQSNATAAVSGSAAAATTAATAAAAAAATTPAVAAGGVAGAVGAAAQAIGAAIAAKAPEARSVTGTRAARFLRLREHAEKGDKKTAATVVGAANSTVTAATGNTTAVVTTAVVDTTAAVVTTAAAATTSVAAVGGSGAAVAGAAAKAAKKEAAAKVKAAKAAAKAAEATAGAATGGAAGGAANAAGAAGGAAEAAKAAPKGTVAARYLRALERALGGLEIEE